VFYEGPPTANGLPHNGHVLTRVIKDLFHDIRQCAATQWLEKPVGYSCLPVEVEVEKQLGIHGKEAIERYGVEPFIRKCLESVLNILKSGKT